MYRDFYQLHARPFDLGTGEAAFYPGRPQRRILAELLNAIALPGALISIEGLPGVGKSTLLAFLEERLRHAGMHVLRARGGTRRSAVTMLADSLGVVCERAEALHAALSRLPLHGRGSLLLLVDEAQELSAPAAAELLDLLLGSARRARLRLALMLRSDVLEPAGHLASLLGRVGPPLVLEPFDLTDTAAYVDHRLRRAGWQGDDLLTSEAQAELHAATGGVARAIHRLGSLLLVQGALDHRRQLEVRDVRDVANMVAADALLTSPVPATSTGEPRTVASLPIEPETEIVRLRQRLDQLQDQLSHERQRHDQARAEAERLRRALHRLQLRQVLAERDAGHRLTDLALRLAAPRLHPGAPEGIADGG